MIQDNEDGEIGICTISVWEVAKLVELGRLVLPVALDQWFTDALAYPGATLVDLTPGIAIESTRLPGSFHRDPADQIIVATSRVLRCDLLTADQRIRDYPHVNTP
jgi:PIN domain nuclease of toxin-antitoxin system